MKWIQSERKQKTTKKSSISSTSDNIFRSVSVNVCECVYCECVCIRELYAQKPNCKNWLLQMCAYFVELSFSFCDAKISAHWNYRQKNTLRLFRVFYWSLAFDRLSGTKEDRKLCHRFIMVWSANGSSVIKFVYLLYYLDWNRMQIKCSLDCQIENVKNKFESLGSFVRLFQLVFETIKRWYL